MVGVLDSIDNATRSTFANRGDTVLLIGQTREELGGSEYLSRIHGIVAGSPPECDLARERAAIDALLECIDEGVVTSAHDISDGGLAVALAECCIADKRHQFGVDATLDVTGISDRAALFSETQARYIVSSSTPAEVESICASAGVPVERIGLVCSASSGFTLHAGSKSIRAGLDEISAAWHDAIPSIMAAPAAAEEPEAALSGV
jgi:phosphoribosylformylglycinamidine synthase